MAQVMTELFFACTHRENSVTVADLHMQLQAAGMVCRVESLGTGRHHFHFEPQPFCFKVFTSGHKVVLVRCALKNTIEVPVLLAVENLLGSLGLSADGPRNIDIDGLGAAFN